jgi:glutamyl-tRNA synthetase
MTPEQIARREARDEPCTIRFKVPREPGGVVFEDAVHGPIDKQYRDIEDFIIVRANGQPLYVLSNAVDDIRDGITHVIRGQDGLANTPKQILIYRGLAAPQPQFVHMSLTLDPKKAKISKRRHGEQVAIHHYRENGFLPWAMVNFLVLLGWSTTDAREWFERDELIAAFNLKGMGRTNSVFNIQADGGKHLTDPKLLNMNAHYLRTLPMEALLPFIKTEFEAAGMWDAAFEGDRAEWFADTMALIRERFFTLKDFVTFGRAYVCETFRMDDDAVKKHLHKDPSPAQWMAALADKLRDLSRFDPETVETALRQFLKDHQVKPGHLMGAVRTAVTGQGVGPDFVRVLSAIGKDRVVSRLESAIAGC